MPYDPYFRHPLDPRYNPYVIQRRGPVKRIKVRRAGDPRPPSTPSAEDNPDKMTETQSQSQQPISSDAIEQQQAIDWQEQYARLQADLENTKKRIEKRYAQRHEDLRARMILDLLPLADHLEAALAHSQEDASSEGLRQGVELTLKAFLDTLSRYGVQVIDPVGEEFNPEFHEAVGVIDDPETPSGHVAKVLQRGYTLDGRIIRPARVLVAK
ncbi:MAG TPA: nucleotide exchange factor GrpE [Caldilineales bacterium]|nr:nucleotide exchange factor GrpE [Caldilineales bacterium]